MSLGGSLAGSLAGSFGASLAGGGGDTIGTAAGASLNARWRPTAGDFAYGTPPAIATMYDIAGALSPAADITNGAATAQPDASSVGGFASANFVANPDKQRLIRATGSPEVLEDTDLYALIAVGKINVSILSNVLFRLYNTAVSQLSGIELVGGNTLRAKCHTTTRGSITADVAFSDNSAIHVFSARLTANDLFVGLDGSETGTGVTSATGGIAGERTRVDIGSHTSTSGSDLDGIEYLTLKNPGAGVAEATIAACVSKYL